MNVYGGPHAQSFVRNWCISILLKFGMVLAAKELHIIQEKVDRIVTPTDIGCVPSKISSGFSGRTGCSTILCYPKRIHYNSSISISGTFIQCFVTQNYHSTAVSRV